MRVGAETPTRFRLNDGGILRSGVGAAAVGVALLLAVLTVVLFTTDASIGDLVLPAGALTTFWVLWLVVALIRSGIARRLDRRGIERLFDDELWAAMRFDAAEWRAVVLARHAPPDGDTGGGVKLAGAFGLAFAIFMTLVGWLATDNRSVSIALTGGGAAVVVLFTAVAAIQPRWQRHVGDREARASLEVAAPDIWFGPTGMYHGADGFTSFRELLKITESTRSKGAIVFTVVVKFAASGPNNSDVTSAAVPVEVEIPIAHRSEAAALTRRYRERIKS